MVTIRHMLISRSAISYYMLSLSGRVPDSGVAKKVVFGFVSLSADGLSG